MKRFVIAGFVVALFASAAELRAQDEPQLPAPEKEHEWLKQLVGEWETEFEYNLGPDAPSQKSQGTESVRAIGELWTVAENKSSASETPFTGIMTLGFDPDKKKYVGTWIDSMFNYLWRYEGTVDKGGKVLTLLTEGPNPGVPGKLCKFKEVIELKSKDHKVFTSSLQGEDCKWSTMMTINYRRKPESKETEKAEGKPGNRVVHFEIPAEKPEELTKFYGELFGWTFQKAPTPGPEYFLCSTGSGIPGIDGAIMKRQNPEQSWMNYVSVASIDESIEKATKLGAKVALPKLPIPNVGAVAAIIDPEGNICGLFEAGAQ